MKHKSLFGLLLILQIAFGHAQELPYKLRYTDAAIMGAGLALEAYMYTLDSPTLDAAELAGFNRSAVNPFDRSATKQWSPSLDKLSDVGTVALLVSPAVVGINLLKDNGFKQAAQYGVLYAETILLTYTCTGAIKVFTERKRPYLYNTDIDDQEKLDIVAGGDGFDSFVSGHTAAAFSAAVFLSKTVQDIYGKGQLSRAVWIGSLGTASAMGFLRYKSGQHFPTDILAGAALGAGIGYLVPSLHRKKNDKLTILTGPTGFHLAYAF